MKILPLVLALAAASSLIACGGASTDDTTSTDDELKGDKCAAPALAAAEDEYGNSPDGTHIKVITKSVKYRVTVGIRNPEDGPHDYYVTFPSGCTSKPSVGEVPSLPHPLRDASHTVYDKIFAKNANTIPASYAVAVSALPAAAHTQYNTWHKQTNCSAVTSYEVSVSGQSTFAVACENTNDSIQRYVVIWDASGGDIDEASIYGAKSGVGTNGVSWQNETFLQQD